MDGIRSVALTLLHTDVHQTKYSPAVVQHPFTSSGIVGVKVDGELQLLDITQDQENLLLWQEQLRTQIESIDSPFGVFLLVNKPYGLTFLKYAEPYLSQADYSKILVSAWMMSENPNADTNFTRRSLVGLFKNADPAVLMDEDERQELATLEDPVTVYRGVTPYNAKNIRALSWTLKYEVAKWFSERFGENGTVYQAQVEKAHIFALFHGRNEAEVIVDPQHLTGIVQTQEPAQKNVMTMGGFI